MPQIINNTRGNDDADYAQRVRSTIITSLQQPRQPTAPRPGGSYYDRVVKHQEDGEEG